MQQEDVHYAQSTVIKPFLMYDRKTWEMRRVVHDLLENENVEMDDGNKEEEKMHVSRQSVLPCLPRRADRSHPLHQSESSHHPWASSQFSARLSLFSSAKHFTKSRAFDRPNISVLSIFYSSSAHV